MPHLSSSGLQIQKKQIISLQTYRITNHFTTDLQNLSLATPFPSTETIQTANGAGLSISHIGSFIIHTRTQKLKLNSVLYVPRITQNLLSVHIICLDNNCWLIFDAFNFWIQDKATGMNLYKGSAVMGYIQYQYQDQLQLKLKDLKLHFLDNK